MKYYQKMSGGSELVLALLEGRVTRHGATPGFNAKPNAHRMCAQQLSFHTYCTENGYRINNVTIYNIYYTNNVLQKTKSNTLET
jgi:hypothetical protein